MDILNLPLPVLCASPAAEGDVETQNQIGSNPKSKGGR